MFDFDSLKKNDKIYVQKQIVVQLRLLDSIENQNNRIGSEYRKKALISNQGSNQGPNIQRLYSNSTFKIYFICHFKLFRSLMQSNSQKVGSVFGFVIGLM